MYDVIIIGGGPAGSTLATYTAQAGLKTAIFESHNHPRPHVGESMVTSTTRIFKEIDFLSTMEKEGFPRKYGAAWHPPQSQASLYIKFDEFPQEGIDQPYTYHVDRSKFDSLLFKHAEANGANCYQGTVVKEVIFKDGYAKGVKVQIAGQSVEIEAKVIVDASGRHTLLGRQLKQKQSDPNFNQFAAHAWFKNVNRGEASTRSDIHIHFLPVERGWVWQIPITDEITSMGVVAEKEQFTSSGHSRDDWFNALIQMAPDIKETMRDAERVNEFKVEADYSYCMNEFVGNGFLLVGDAARFVDPIFSSGVSIAMHSAKFASEAIISACKSNDFSKERFSGYQERLKKGTKIWYEFISLYYKLLPLFTHFIESKEYRLQVLQLLQGEVFDREEVPVLDAMRDFIMQVESSDSHLLKKYLDESLAV